MKQGNEIAYGLIGLTGRRIPRESEAVADVEYREIDVGELESLRPLWEQLNAYHARIAGRFSGDFESYTFDERIRRLVAEKSDLHILVAENEDGHRIGYAIGSIAEAGTRRRGELDSIFVEEEYRGGGIGEELARRILEWVDSHEPHSVVIAVVTGNERALPFYERLGFAPRAYTLRRVPDGPERVP